MLQKRAQLEKLLLTFSPDGRFADAEVLYKIGAWDTDTDDWHGSPKSQEDTLTTLDPTGRKMLNDILGTTTLKALDTATVATKVAEEKTLEASTANARLRACEQDLRDALGARDNFAALEKKARGELLSLGKDYDTLASTSAQEYRNLNKIPRWIRALFRAT